MLKKLMIYFVLVFVSMLLVSCDALDRTATTISSSNYEIWRNSNEARDFNGDRIIDMQDYAIFLAGTSTNITTTASENTGSTNSTTIVTLSAYEIWKRSDTAQDYNGDRKINELDYEIYQVENYYDYWRESEYAEDLNGDRKINEIDHEIYRLYNNYNYWRESEYAEDLNGDTLINSSDHRIYKDYLTWIGSEEAQDLNNDTIINVVDFEIYEEFKEFKGNYYITNYVYVGSTPITVVGTNPEIFVQDLGFYLAQILISVNHAGVVSLTIPHAVRTALGDFISTIIEGSNNMTISRLSPFVVVIDTNVTVNDVNVNFTLYLNTATNGYSTSYTIGTFDDIRPEITFNIARID
jgi:hypothetical protein